ncbi:MAG: YfhO family protein, partial [Treponema succinifaciens]|uniref:YfhO family protein n=1 Tax=Treponema succinifaciens TaxID=167 RepID=UPI002A75A336
MAQKNNLLTFPAKRNFNCFQVKTFLIYSLLFCLLVPLCFFQFFVYGKSFCSGDGITEHTAFLAFYGEWLRTIAYNFIHGKFIVPTFSFSLGFGADIISSLTWFCIGDPLNLLSIFVPKNGTYILFVFLAVLRFYLSGISFIFYCNTHKFQKNIIPFGAISYSFCGYALFVGIRHPYFLNPLIFLPLLCIGIDKILDRKSPMFFIIFSFLACVCNYYFFYMLSFFAFVYAAVRFFFVVKIERKFLCKEFFKTFFRAFGFYMIAVMMAAFILLPSAYGFLTASRTTEKIEVNFFYSLAYYANLFSSVSSPASVGGFFGSIGFAPVVFVTLLFLFTLNDKISKQLKIFILLGVLFFICPFFGHFINGFNYITNRWCFAFAFLGCVSFVYAFPIFCKSSFKELKIPLLIAVVQNLLVVFSCIISQARRQHYALCYIYSLAVFLILYFLIKKRKDIRIFSLVSIFIGIVVIAFVRYSPYGLSYLDDFREFGIYEGNVAKNTDIEISKLNEA